MTAAPFPAVSPFGPKLFGADVLRAIALMLLLDLCGWPLVAALDTLGDDATYAARINREIAYDAVVAISALVAMWFVFVRQRGLAFADLGFTVPARRWAIYGVTLGTLFVALQYAGYYLVEASIGRRFESGDWPHLAAADIGALQAVTLVLYSAVLVPVGEELLFRGALFRYLRQRFAFWPAALVSAGLFGLAHVEADRIVATAAVGVCLAWLYERTRSLGSAILMHQSFNLLVTAMALGWDALRIGPAAVQ